MDGFKFIGRISRNYNNTHNNKTREYNLYGLKYIHILTKLCLKIVNDH